jgi:hypothetical protein
MINIMTAIRAVRERDVEVRTRKNQCDKRKKGQKGGDAKTPEPSSIHRRASADIRLDVRGCVCWCNGDEGTRCLFRPLRKRLEEKYAVGLSKADGKFRVIPVFFLV